MVSLRSSYLAAGVPNSGGLFGKTYASELDGRIAPLMASHGKMGDDVWILDFAETTVNQCKDVASKGGFMVDCDHGAGHCENPPETVRAQWKFLKDHPFGVNPEPYAAGLPSGTPAYCKICSQ